jgi:hypothetical protein
MNFGSTGGCHMPATSLESRGAQSRPSGVPGRRCLVAPGSAHLVSQLVEVSDAEDGTLGPRSRVHRGHPPCRRASRGHVDWRVFADYTVELKTDRSVPRELASGSPISPGRPFSP